VNIEQSIVAESPAESPDALVKTDPFLKTLASIIRATDSYGTWDKQTDAELLQDFVVDKAARRLLPVIGDPDPEVLARVEQYYRTVGLRIEQRTGLMSSPMMTMSHEGFGRLILTAGKLVAYAKTLRDVHRFGFDSLKVLGAEGEKVVAAAVADIERFAEVAHA
jgi:probable nitrogen fixation protein